MRFKREDFDKITRLEIMSIIVGGIIDCNYVLKRRTRRRNFGFMGRDPLVGESTET